MNQVMQWGGGWKGKETDSLQSLQKENLGFTLRKSILYFWPPELQENNCVLFQAVSLWSFYLSLGSPHLGILSTAFFLR